MLEDFYKRFYKKNIFFIVLGLGIICWTSFEMNKKQEKMTINCFFQIEFIIFYFILVFWFNSKISYFQNYKQKEIKLIRIKELMIEQLNSSEFQILCKILDSSYLTILTFEWVDKLGEVIQVKNCHRVTRNYFRNSKMFLQKIKNKLRKKLIDIDYGAFKQFFARISEENKKYNIFDRDVLISQSPFHPDPDNFENLEINFSNMSDEANQNELNRFERQNNHRTLNQNWRTNFLNMGDDFYSSKTTNGLPNLKYQMVNSVPSVVLPEKIDRKILNKMTIQNQLKELYKELNQINLCIETKIQLLKLNQYRKFTNMEFNEYLVNKQTIETRLGMRARKFRESITKRTMNEYSRFNPKDEDALLSNSDEKPYHISNKTRDGKFPHFYIFLLNFRKNESKKINFRITN